MTDRYKLTGLWLLLLLLTVAMAQLTEPYQVTFGLVIIVLLGSVIKAAVLVEYFMGLKQAPLLWRGLMLAYVPVLAICISLTYVF
ncbi:cytochrome C oxidase subunit IV family protein [Amphritea pacifica]|uniref:Cytochrome C oxidase subunit IV family protein n=1 Tax=Amphritea pacifica TaxID=2811233 RepID=A0ABS2WBX3_9GAMM|nr:cytochrome C oxidase subunit IV family protein [Amphritea pacifica]MBN0989219.1 cytochrome C oxidase subunit IV family protein [Amphritea pacifica]